MPHTIGLAITLVDDLIVTEAPATAGSPRTLRYIPGAALLGLVASSLYCKLGKDAFDVFHSGKVRFHNAYPAIADKDGKEWDATWPVPASIHWLKDNRPQANGSGFGDQGFYNLATATIKSGEQYQQARDEFVSPLLHAANIKLTTALKTAFDLDRGRPLEAQLFGFEALSAGQVFIGSIDVDDGVNKATTDLIKNALCGRRQIGRSRSSEFGSVDIQMLDSIPPPSAERASSDSTVIWALSDLCLSDQFGQPVLDPSEGLIPGESFEIDWQHTFIRSRSYAPFNAKWSSRGESRAVIAMGSVITLKKPATKEQKDAITKGVGRYQEAGLGRVCIDPSCLSTDTPKGWNSDLIAISSNTSATPEPDKATKDLLDHLQKRRTQRTGATDAASKAIENVQSLFHVGGYYDQVCTFQGQRDRIAVVAPGRTQWNAVAVCARDAKTALDLNKALFDDKDGPCKQDNAIWNARYGADPNATFSGLLKEIIKESGDQAPHVIALLARSAADRVEDWRSKK